MGREIKTWKIEISMKDGEILYDKYCDSVRVYRVTAQKGDKIQWICEFGDRFAIHVGWNSPLDFISQDGPAGPKSEPITGTVQEDAHFDEFKYSVAVWDVNENKIWTDDPRFIVRRG